VEHENLVMNQAIKLRESRKIKAARIKAHEDRVVIQKKRKQ
jgi:hypothetical protein